MTASRGPHGAQTNAMPPWARVTIYTLGGIAAFCILLSSCWSLGSLAVQAGLGWPQLLLLPVALGLGAIVAGVLWVAGQGQMRDTGKWATIALVFAFAVFNAADSLARHGVLTGGQLMFISVLIAAVFPVTAGVLGHIARLARSVPSRYSFTERAAPKNGLLLRVKQRVAAKRGADEQRPDPAARPSSSWWPRQERSENGKPIPDQKATDQTDGQATLPYQATVDQRGN